MARQKKTSHPLSASAFKARKDELSGDGLLIEGSTVEEPEAPEAPEAPEELDVEREEPSESFETREVNLGWLSRLFVWLLVLIVATVPYVVIAYVASQFVLRMMIGGFVSLLGEGSDSSVLLTQVIIPAETALWTLLIVSYPKWVKLTWAFKKKMMPAIQSRLENHTERVENRRERARELDAHVKQSRAERKAERKARKAEKSAQREQFSQVESA